MAKDPKGKKVTGDVPQREAEQRRDAIIKKLLETPPKPRKRKGGVVVKGDDRPERKGRSR